MKRIVLSLALLAVAAPTTAFAGKLAEQMTCEELVTSFEQTKSVTKLVHGKPTTLRGGIPIRKTQGLQCGPNNYTIDRVSAATLDKRACVYAVICHGKADTSRLGY